MAWEVGEVDQIREFGSATGGDFAWHFFWSELLRRARTTRLEEMHTGSYNLTASQLEGRGVSTNGAFE